MKIQAKNVQTNISSVIGNATSFYIEYIKKLFPTGFFKDSFIVGTLPSIEREAKDFINRAKPTLIINPEYNAESGLMGDLPIWHNAYQYIFNNCKEYYNGVLTDTDRGIFIYGIPDRIKLNMMTKIVMPTKVYAINVLHHIKQTIEPGGRFYLDNKYFENEIPTPYIKLILNILEEKEHRKFSLDNPDDIKYIEDYFNRYSYNGCISRRNLSTGNEEFAFKYKSNILMGMESLPTIDNVKRGKSDELSIITFDIEFEFETNSNFILQVPDDTKINKIESENDYFDSEGRYTFNITIPVDPVKEMEGDFRLRYKKKLIAEANVEIDRIPFESILSEDVLNFIKPHINKNTCQFKQNEEAAKILLFTNSIKLGEADYHVDWAAMELLIHHPMGNMVYGFAFYINQLMYSQEAVSKQEQQLHKMQRKLI